MVTGSSGAASSAVSRRASSGSAIISEGSRILWLGLTTLLRALLGKGHDRSHNFRLDLGALVDGDVGNHHIGCDVDVRKLALETAAGRQRRPPAGALIVVHRAYDIRGNGTLHERRKRHQKVNGNFVSFQRPGHFDHVVRALGVPHQNERAGLACGSRLNDLGNGRFPGQMPYRFGLGALRVERGGKFIHAGREHAEPSSQEIHAGLGSLRDTARKQANE